MKASVDSSRERSSKVNDSTDGDPTIARLENQIAWYDRKSLRNENLYKRLKVVEIVSAAIIPFVSGLTVLDHIAVTASITGALGALIAILEGVQQLNQYQHNWITYRSTCESLKHEKYLYLAGGRPYGGSRDPHTLLAERLEALISQENSRWVGSEEQPARQAGARAS